ncbi:hypothetical protein J5J10_19805 [Ciceribacter sp. L1K23]|uniref:hypothetical protein n=1 Tax=Ciceribacter sp. L1K23 TaxID=2820276 RepID=UPI001B81DF27|nr:hypothetical protein [Ciceribacter sp. L1K23]MBR0557941.1 hypothetical protein [Ciceribacter sp. L1K23]
MKTAVEELEGRLNAQREVLISLLAMIMKDRPPPDLRWLEDDAVPRNGEEDPGVVPSVAFATQGAMATEMRAILDAARSRANAG